jgi:hypothetical protein
MASRDGMLAGLERLARPAVVRKKNGLRRVIGPKEFGLLEKNRKSFDLKSKSNAFLNSNKFKFFFPKT